jgi:transglutaminase-like putative cysteine protease
VSWAAIRDEATVARFGEFLAQTPYTSPAASLAEQAERLATELDPQHCALAICALVHEKLTYVPGSTGVRTTAAEAWLTGTGVCQDYAHIVLGALRHVGLPARYVSGYLHPEADPVVGVPAVGESHAWVEWWLGDWAGHDPTNDADVDERHVIVGRGRDYADVPPIKGLVSGPSGASELEVTVEITRLA